MTDLSLLAMARELGGVIERPGSVWCHRCGCTIADPGAIVEGRYTSAVVLVEDQPGWECQGCLVAEKIDLTVYPLA